MMASTKLAMEMRKKGTDSKNGGESSRVPKSLDARTEGEGRARDDFYILMSTVGWMAMIISWDGDRGAQIRHSE